MPIAKTEKARVALANRDDALSAKARQILVMCDGKRSRRELEALFGSAGAALLAQLVGDGYLQDVQARTRPAPNASSAKPVQAFEAAASRSRRSIAATKMYMIDMLQLLRNVEASSLAVALHTSADEQEFMANVFVALRFIADKSGASYAVRVHQRLLETVPEPHLPRLEALGAELFPAADITL